MIGERIKKARMALGYSAEQVAAFLNVSPATVYRYENGDISKLPSKFIKPLADYLCVTPAYLMGWEDEQEQNYQAYLKMYLESKVEQELINTYRSLSLHGKNLLLDRAKELKILYGKKSEDSTPESVQHP